MRRLLFLALALAVLAGCDKWTKKKDAPATPAAPEGPGVHAPTGVVVNPGLGGGGGGAAQAVRKAAGRAVSQNDLHNLHLFINTASSVGPMPSRADILAGVRTDAPQLHRQIQNGDIVLTGIRSREGVWAWTKQPQSAAGEHLVVTNSGVERMTAQALTDRLQQQGQ